MNSKMMDLAGLAAQAAAHRTAGRRVVLAHGVFDLVHLGHVRYLEQAKRHGDVLFVTLTADRFVNKGPGRPVFPAQMRAEMIAALAPVDGVAINDAPTAEPVLEALRPDFYVKGAEYADEAADVTGGITRERLAVERHGGQLVFTDDVVFSSSSLINKHLNIYQPELRDYLHRVREDGLMDRALSLIESARDLKVLLIGDAIIDEYQYVQPMAKSPKENLIATLFQDREIFAGGVIAAANHVANLCGKVDVITALGTGAEGYEDLVRQSLHPEIGLEILHRDGKPTTRKCRFIDPGYLRKLFEVYVMEDAPLDPALEQHLLHLLADRAGEYDLVLVTDFGHGLITPPIIDALSRHARFLAVNAQTNSANLGFNLITRYPRADFLCLDAPEARLATADKYGDLGHVASKLAAHAGCQRVIITHGKQGCLAWDATGDGIEVTRIPAFTGTVVDTVGAGDAFLSITAPLVAAAQVKSSAMADIAFIGNAAGAIKVGIVGHRRPVEKASLLKFLTALLK